MGTQELRNDVRELMNMAAMHARQSSRGNHCEDHDRANPSGIHTERPTKRRCESILDVQRVLRLTFCTLVDRKVSPTQPGRGIRKIVDLYHDLTALLDKGGKHFSEATEDLDQMEELNQTDFRGMTEEEIEDE